MTEVYTVCGAVALGAEGAAHPSLGTGAAYATVATRRGQGVASLASCCQK